MDIEAVPQEGVKTYGGFRKAVYAKNADGRIVLAPSTGWHVEEIVMRLVVDGMAAHAAAARQRVMDGLSSPLKYWMYARRMDALWLAQSSGVSRWRVRRHLKPGPFSRLSSAQIARYADALGVSSEDLQRLPRSCT